MMICLQEGKAMNNELTLFDDQLPQEHSEQDVAEFHYEVLDPDDREFVQKKEYEIHTHWDRATEEILESGEKLLLVQERLKKTNKGKNGSFEGWLKRSGFSRSDAFFSMKAYTRFGNNRKVRTANFSRAALKEMTYSSDEVVAGVISGEIRPTRNAIREEEQKRKKAEAERNQARIDEAKAKADAQAAQQQLFLLEQTSQTEIDALTEQYIAKIQELQSEIKELEENATPKIEIREVPKEVLPLSVKNNIESLQNRVNELTSNLEAEKKTIPPEAQKQMEDLQTEAKRQTEALQKQLEALKEKNRLQEQANKAQEDRLKNLDSQLKIAIKDRITSENDERIRQEWRMINSEARSCMMRLLGSWPTSLDIQSFESDDWERLSQLKSTLKRVLEECDNLNYGGDDMIVNEKTAEEPIAYIESPMSYMSHTGDNHG